MHTDDPKTFNERMATSYHRVLTTHPWDDELAVASMSEGRLKMLSHAHFRLVGTGAGSERYFGAHFVSEAAREILQRGPKQDELRFEHLVPKTRYIQQPCEEAAQAGTLTRETVLDYLDRYWWTATVTKEEDERLEQNTMPKDWDGKDIFARYREAGIALEVNPHLPEGLQAHAAQRLTID